jgi:hypothetical protein
VHVYPQGTVEPIQRPNAADLPRPDLPGQTQEPDKIRPKRGADSGGMVAQQADAMRTLRRAERHESAPTSPARPAPEAAPPSAGAKPSDGGLMDMVSDATKKLVEEQRRARENEPPTGQPRGGRKR